MELTNVIEMYGLVDYMDQNTGNIYCLSMATEKDDKTYVVPVKDYRGILIGHCECKNPKSY